MTNQCMKDEEGLLLVEPLQELYKEQMERNVYRWDPEDNKPWNDEKL